MGFKLFLNSRFFFAKAKINGFYDYKISIQSVASFQQNVGGRPLPYPPLSLPSFPSSLEVGPLNLARESGAGGCIFGPKGAIQIRYYFIIIIMK